MSLYTSKTTKLELTQIIDRLNSENAALRSDLAQAQGDLDRLRNAPPENSRLWLHGPRPATPAEVRDPSFKARAETMRKVGAYLAGILNRPATRGEVLAKINELA